MRVLAERIMDDKKMTAEQAWAERDAALGRMLAAKEAYKEAVRLIRDSTNAFNRSDVAARDIGPRPPAEPPNCLAELRHSGEIGDRRHS